MREGLIIERPRLQSRGQRTTSAILRLLGWGFWILVWLPLITFAGWAMGVGFVVDYMLLPDSWEYLHSLTGYVFVVACLGIGVTGWSLYNLKRYGRRERRLPPMPATPEDMSTFFHVEPATISCAQNAKLAVLHLSEAGQLQKVDVRKLTEAVPRIYVSATCFNVRRLQGELEEAIRRLGYEPVLSRHAPFPLEPDESTMESCRKAVQERADILILFLGGRYNAPTDWGKPLSNLECSWAQERGLPVCVFVERSLLRALPDWKEGALTRLEEVADSGEILRFLSELESMEGVSVHGFEDAEEVESVLRRRMASLFKESLTHRLTARAQAPSDLAGEALDTPALRLIAEKPLAWEAQLFSRLLVEEVDAAEPRRMDLELGINLGDQIWFPTAKETAGWLGSRLDGLERRLISIDRILGPGLERAVGASGEHGSERLIVHLARSFGQAYHEILEAAQELQRLSLPDRRWAGLIRQAVQAATEVLDEIQRLRDDLREGPRFTVTASGQVETPIQLTFQPTLERHNLSALRRELERLRDTGDE